MDNLPLFGHRQVLHFLSFILSPQNQGTFIECHTLVSRLLNRRQLSKGNFEGSVHRSRRNSTLTLFCMFHTSVKKVFCLVGKKLSGVLLIFSQENLGKPVGSLRFLCKFNCPLFYLETSCEKNESNCLQNEPHMTAAESFEL